MALPLDILLFDRLPQFLEQDEDGIGHKDPFFISMRDVYVNQHEYHDDWNNMFAPTTSIGNNEALILQVVDNITYLIYRYELMQPIGIYILHQILERVHEHFNPSLPRLIDVLFRIGLESPVCFSSCFKTLALLARDSAIIKEMIAIAMEVADESPLEIRTVTFSCLLSFCMNCLITACAEESAESLVLELLCTLIGLVSLDSTAVFPLSGLLPQFMAFLDTAKYPPEKSRVVIYASRLLEGFIKINSGACAEMSSAGLLLHLVALTSLKPDHEHPADDIESLMDRTSIESGGRGSHTPEGCSDRSSADCCPPPISDPHCSALLSLLTVFCKQHNPTRLQAQSLIGINSLTSLLRTTHPQTLNKVVGLFSAVWADIPLHERSVIAGNGAASHPGFAGGREALVLFTRLAVSCSVEILGRALEGSEVEERQEERVFSTDSACSRTSDGTGHWSRDNDSPEFSEKWRSINPHGLNVQSALKWDRLHSGTGVAVSPRNAMFEYPTDLQGTFRHPGESTTSETYSSSPFIRVVSTSEGSISSLRRNSSASDTGGPSLISSKPSVLAAHALSTLGLTVSLLAMDDIADVMAVGRSKLIRYFDAPVKIDLQLMHIVDALCVLCGWAEKCHERSGSSWRSGEETWARDVGLELLHTREVELLREWDVVMVPTASPASGAATHVPGYTANLLINSVFQPDADLNDGCMSTPSRSNPRIPQLQLSPPTPPTAATGRNTLTRRRSLSPYNLAPVKASLQDTFLKSNYAVQSALSGQLPVYGHLEEGLTEPGRESDASGESVFANTCRRLVHWSALVRICRMSDLFTVNVPMLAELIVGVMDRGLEESVPPSGPDGYASPRLAVEMGQKCMQLLSAILTDSYIHSAYGTVPAASSVLDAPEAAATPSQLTTVQLQAALVWAVPAADFAISTITQHHSLYLLAAEAERGTLSSSCTSALSLLISLAPLERSIRRRILKALPSIFSKSYYLQGYSAIAPLLLLLCRCIDTLGKIDAAAEEELCHITVLALHHADNHVQLLAARFIGDSSRRYPGLMHTVFGRWEVETPLAKLCYNEQRPAAKLILIAAVTQCVKEVNMRPCWVHSRWSFRHTHYTQSKASQRPVLRPSLIRHFCDQVQGLFVSCNMSESNSLSSDTQSLNSAQTVCLSKSHIFRVPLLAGLLDLIGAMCANVADGIIVLEDVSHTTELLSVCHHAVIPIIAATLRVVTELTRLPREEETHPPPPPAASDETKESIPSASSPLDDSSAADSSAGSDSEGETGRDSDEGINSAKAASLAQTSSTPTSRARAKSRRASEGAAVMDVVLEGEESPAGAAVAAAHTPVTPPKPPLMRSRSHSPVLQAAAGHSPRFLLSRGPPSESRSRNSGFRPRSRSKSASGASERKLDTSVLSRGNGRDIVTMVESLAEHLMCTMFAVFVLQGLGQVQVPAQSSSRSPPRNGYGEKSTVGKLSITPLQVFSTYAHLFVLAEIDLAFVSDKSVTLVPSLLPQIAHIMKRYPLNAVIQRRGLEIVRTFVTFGGEAQQAIALQHCLAACIGSMTRDLADSTEQQTSFASIVLALCSVQQQGKGAHGSTFAVTPTPSSPFPTPPSPSARGPSPRSPSSRAFSGRQQAESKESARNAVVKFGLQRGLADILLHKDVEASLQALAAVVAVVGESHERAELLCHGTGLLEALLGLLETKGTVDKGDKRVLVEGLGCLVALRGAVQSNSLSPDDICSGIRIRSKILLRKGMGMIEDLMASGHPVVVGCKEDRRKLMRTRFIHKQGLEMLYALSLMTDGRERGSCTLM